MKKTIIGISLLWIVGMLVACSGGGGGKSSAPTGTVGLYITDAMGDYQQVTATLKDVQLRHTGQGRSCDLLVGEESVDIANLGDTLHWLDNTECEVTEYNRLYLEFDQTVDLMDGNNTAGSCSFVSWKEKGGSPNRLTCIDNTCSIEMTGAVNVVAGQITPLALDFDLKEFEVQNFGETDCAVTMKVEPLNHNDMENQKQSGYSESLTGSVSLLDSTLHTFLLTTKRDTTLTVDYSQSVSNGLPQPGLDALLDFAQTGSLKTRVLAETVVPDSEGSITATTIYVKLDGRLSDLDQTAMTFTLSSDNLVIQVDYSVAENSGQDDSDDNVEGILVDDAWVEVKLYGVDSSVYFVHEVEVEDSTAPDTND
ncbi:MAG: DUF4382 domain-containing protein [Proteobacteria bacterium]|nr:DUF4382 domain-containing protein [Pseudomonadota bacterium]MBU1687480.1 DUF4382 domain-containing protein [Pseudomonadota bacterium]